MRAHRAQPPLVRAWAASSSSRPGSRATTPDRHRRSASSRRCSRRTATPRTRSASGTSRPTTRRTSRRRACAGRSVAASSASTGSSTEARRTRTRRRSCTTTTSSTAAPIGRGRIPPHRGPRRPGDRVRHRPAPRRHRQAVLPLLRDRCVPLAPPVAARVGRALPRPLRPGVGRMARSRRWRARSRPACCPRAPSCRRARSGCPRGTRSPTTPAAVYARFMEAFAGFLSHTDHQLGRLVGLPGGGRRARRHAPDPACPTTALSSEGGPIGSLNDVRAVELRGAVDRRGARPHRRDRRAAHPQQLPVGLDRRRQHAVPALEARGARGRRRRSAHRALARGIADRGACPAPVRARHRPRCPPCSRTIGVDAPRRVERRSRSDRSRAPASRRRSSTSDAPICT